MSENTQDVNPEADAQDADATDQTQASEQDSQPTGFDALPKETQDEIRKLRRENAGLRTKVKGFEDSSKTEAERQADALADMTARAEAAEKRVADATKRDALTAELVKANVKNLKGALRMVDLDDLDVQEDGSVANLEAVLESLQSDIPELFGNARPASLDGGKTGTHVTNRNMNDVFRDLARNAR